jgi:ABC-type glycerol-3-phosphate transport system substrate-binding protein
MVADPPTTLDGLLTAARAGTGVALPRTFQAAYWGAPAYGATLFAQDGRLLLDQGGFVVWLAWMREMNTLPSVTMDNDRNNRAAFLDGSAAYYVGPPEALPEVQEALGAEAVGTVVLPSGPVTASAPFLTTTAYVIAVQDDGNQQALALDFGHFLTGVDSQTTLTEQTLRVPANVNVSLDAYPNLSTFRQQALQVTILPKIPERIALLARGNNVYRAVLDEDVSPEVAVPAFVNGINEANGFELTEIPVTATPDAEVTITPDAITPTATSEGD